MGDVKRFPAPITPEQPVYLEDDINPDEAAVIEAARDWLRARDAYLPGYSPDRWQLDRAERELELAVRALD